MNKLEFEEIELFRVSVFKTNLSGLVDNHFLRSYLETKQPDIKWEDPNTIRISPEEISDLLSVIKKVFVGIDPPFKNYIMNMVWGHVIRPGETGEVHNHSWRFRDPTVISWIYYVDVPDEAGPLRFHPEYKSIDVGIYPKNSDLIIFNGELHHSVQRNMSEKTRFSIAGNIVLEERHRLSASKKLAKYMNAHTFNPRRLIK